VLLIYALLSKFGSADIIVVSVEGPVLLDLPGTDLGIFLLDLPWIHSCYTEAQLPVAFRHFFSAGSRLIHIFCHQNPFLFFFLRRRRRRIAEWVLRNGQKRRVSRFFGFFKPTTRDHSPGLKTHASTLWHNCNFKYTM